MIIYIGKEHDILGVLSGVPTGVIDKLVIEKSDLTEVEKQMIKRVTSHLK